jgi:prepilin-type N-terminal cleavage/methylation domain-containing protein
MPRIRPSSAGFTLVELLSAIAVIAIIASIGFGLIRLGSSPQASLRTAQGNINGLVTAARAQAATTGRPVHLFVVNDPAVPNLHLRFLGIAQQPLGSSPSAPWEMVGTGVLLPQGTYIVPHNAGALFATLNSTAFNTSITVTINGTTLTTPALLFDARGLPDIATAARIVVAEGTGLGAGIELANPDGVRGVILNGFGVAILADNRVSLQ